MRQPKKNCIHCGVILSNSNRTPSYMRKQVNNVCKNCLRKRAKVNSAKWRERHPERNKQVWVNSNKKASLIYNEMKINYIKKVGGCQLCGYNDFSCLPVYEFHHTDNDKETNLSYYRRTVNKTLFLEEAKKCIIVCANCHRKIHHNYSQNSTIIFKEYNEK